ncbi:membrane protein [Vibrio caribbeanicus]|uniref:Membrane protein n=1 Tax=Vibrio caribbeanicus TaxID=701175 RepID=A0ACC4NXL5_9VIBR|nr:VTT domain-containing protein [Vibrio caribbeanicus]KHD25285.1 membrane protein [Vibrio caribbeanicus]
MLDSITSILFALWNQDFSVLQSPGSAVFIYAIVASLIFLESGFIPAAPFPCDSVVVLSGTLAAVGVLLTRHGLVALFSARFIPVVRSLLPLMMGMRAQQVKRFHYFSWLSAILWTLLLCSFGMLLPTLPETISKYITVGLMAAPVITLCVAILSMTVIKLRKVLVKPLPSQSAKEL